MIKTILMLMLMLFFAGMAEAKNLYVATNGNDSVSYANNSQATPWATIGRAAWGSTARSSPNASQAAQAGDIVYVAAGTYHNTSGYSGNAPLYGPVNSGNTTDGYITFQAVGTVTLTTGPITADFSDGSPIIGSSGGTSHIKWDGFTINQANVNFRGGNGLINIWGNYTTISNCNLTGIYTNYPWGDDQHNAILAKGPDVSATCTGELEGLQIINNTLTGFTGSSGRNDSAITVYCLGSAIIEHNEFFNNRNAIYAKSAYDDSQGVHIRYNIFRNNTEGIGMQSHSYWYVYQNIFKDNSYAVNIMATIYQQGTNKPRYNYFVNNTFDNNDVHFYWRNDNNFVNNNFVYNNIFNDANTHGILSEEVGNFRMTPTQIRFSRNIWYAYQTFLSNANGTATFSTWQSATFGNQDINSHNGINPLFVSVATDNFRLQGNSPALNAGIDVLDLDRDGQTNDVITIGAYITGNEVIGRLSPLIATAPPGSVR